MKSRMPEDGELVNVNSSEKFRYPHGVALYLSDGKIIIPSYMKGWIITDIEGLDNCRPFGRSNIKRTLMDEDGETVIGYDFLAYDSGKATELNIRKIEGQWKIENKFDMPSWTK